MKVWIVGTWHSRQEDERAAWTLNGIFSSKELAIAAVRTPKDFIAPWTIDHDLTTFEGLMDGQYYPLSEEDPGEQGNDA